MKAENMAQKQFTMKVDWFHHSFI